MSSITTFKSYHVYTLRRALTPNGRPARVLVITSPSFSNHNDQPALSAIPLSDNPRRRTDRLSVCITGRLPMTQSGGGDVNQTLYANIGGIFPVSKSDFIMASATPIRVVEEHEVKEKMMVYFGLGL